jgi:LacI family transcriptional regulator
MNASSIRIGLVLDYSLGYCRAVLRGIQSLAEARPNWLLTLVSTEPAAIDHLRTLRPDGLIAYIDTRAVAKRLLSFGRPLVNISAIVPDLPTHRVVVDDQLLGRMAAAHLLERRFVNFGFVGHAKLHFSCLREQGFREELRAAGVSPASYGGAGLPPRHLSSLVWPLDVRVQKWLAALPKPVGIFVPSDTWAYQLLEVCRQMRLSVPDEVAMIAVAVDELLCELARPPLSSIAIPAERIGKEAAALLDRQLTARRGRHSTLLLPPLGVITRQSTDLVAIDDPEVAAAVRFIAARGLAHIQVSDVVRAVPLPRRTLERRFRAVVGRGIGQEIRRVRLERARFLLTSTNYSMSEVAERSGISDAKQLSAAFHSETGLTPTAFRRRSRDMLHRGVDGL